MLTSRIALVSVMAAACYFTAACEKKPAADKGKTPAKADHDHDHDHDHGHGHDDHDHAKDIALGTATAGGFEIKASIAETVKAGAEAHISVTVTGGTTQVSVVRVWIGSEDAKGSVKEKADKEEHGFHGHATAPDPLPAGSKLWVEVEDDKGAKHPASFDLK